MSLEDRIQLLKPDHFSDSDQQIIIEETIHDGKASLLLVVSRRCLALHKADKRRIAFLKNQQVADCIMVELQDEKAIALHIFEFKKTITSDSWETTQLQFEGAFYNGLGLLGILGLDLPNKIFYGYPVVSG
jgi:hypothetical protein